jgi:hypothetical protein
MAVGVKQKIETLFLLPIDLMNPLESLKKAIVNNEAAILDENRAQMDRGLTSKGKSIGRYRRFSYKQRFQPVDLLKDGDFRRQMNIEVDNKETRVFSQNFKDAKLRAKYGENIFGLSSQAIINVAAKLGPEFYSGVKKKLFK